MTNFDIDRALALAIGYPADRVRNSSHGDGWVQVQNKQNRGDGPYPASGGWQKFDHTDWSVIGPIAQLFDAFPMYHSTEWGVLVGVAGVEVYHMCAATASALAVIEYCD